MHVTVENTGTYPVQEAVQVYVRFSEREAYDPGYQLKGIRSVALECGEKKEVCITLSTRDFALISEEGKCLVHPGSYEIAVGGQQPDERSSRLMHHFAAGTDSFRISANEGGKYIIRPEKEDAEFQKIYRFTN